MSVPLDVCPVAYAETPSLEIRVFQRQQRILRSAICMETTSVLANKVASFFWLLAVRLDWQALSVQLLKSVRSCKACAGRSLYACKVFLYGSDRRYFGGQGSASGLMLCKVSLCTRLEGSVSGLALGVILYTRRAGRWAFEWAIFLFHEVY